MRIAKFRIIIIVKKYRKCLIFPVIEAQTSNISRKVKQFRTYTKARGFSKIEHTVIAWDSRYLPELESEMRSVLDIDMSYFGFEVCINFVRMRSENVPHLYFWHTAIGIQNQKYRLCDFPCAENNYVVWKINVLFYEAARLYPALKSSRKLVF